MVLHLPALVCLVSVESQQRWSRTRCGPSRPPVWQQAGAERSLSSATLVRERQRDAATVCRRIVSVTRGHGLCIDWAGGRCCRCSPVRSPIGACEGKGHRQRVTGQPLVPSPVHANVWEVLDHVLYRARATSEQKRPRASATCASPQDHPHGYSPSAAMVSSLHLV